MTVLEKHTFKTKPVFETKLSTAVFVIGYSTSLYCYPTQKRLYPHNDISPKKFPYWIDLYIHIQESYLL